MNEINKRKAAQAQTTSTTITTRRVEPSNNYDNFANPQISERCRNRWYAFVGVVTIIIIIVLICTGDIDLSTFGWDTDDDDDYYYYGGSGNSGGGQSSTGNKLIYGATWAVIIGATVIPMVRPSAELGFWQYVFRIAAKVFPVLVLPCLLAWLVRYTMPRLQARLFRWAPNSFYIWFFGLLLAMILATRALLMSHLGAGAIAGIVGVSLATCALQFWAGRHAGGDRATRITAGQSLGQKNTGFLIWLGYNYLTPVTSVAGGLYAIWQNIFNSSQLYRENHREA